MGHYTTASEGTLSAKRCSNTAHRPARHCVFLELVTPDSLLRSVARADWSCLPQCEQQREVYKLIAPTKNLFGIFAHLLMYFACVAISRTSKCPD